jgi:putative hydrolase of the HAD superfamily
MRYSGVIFDLDDTIWDFQANAVSAIKYLHQDFEKRYKLGTTYEKFYHRYEEINKMLWEEYERGERESQTISFTRFKLLAQSYEQEMSEYESRGIADMYLDRLYQGKKLMPYAREILEYLSKKYKLGLLTNGFAKGLSRLENCDIKKYLSYAISSQMYGEPKPNVGIFHHVADKLDISYDKCIFVGDNYNIDIVGAKNAGFDTVFYNVHGYTLSKDEIAADHIIDSLEELKNIL